MKVIIAGSRTFKLKQYPVLKRVCDSWLEDYDDITIVSGTAKGADKLGELYGKQNDYPIKKFPADWDAFGKSAGYRRNVEMAEYADMLIAFWDGKSKGTEHMINIAKERNLIVKIQGF